jgi:hypothetical protein
VRSVNHKVMKVLKTREELLHLFPGGGTMAEVGVFRGGFSEKILDVCKPEKFYMVDIWEGKMMSGDKDGKSIVKIPDMQEVYENEILPKFGVLPNVKVIRETSTDFFNRPEFVDSLDAIYIDALHTYKAVLKDLEGARKVVKSGGIIMGHDYGKKFPGVIKAVDEFCEKNGLQIEYLTEDGCPSYYIVNNK